MTQAEAIGAPVLTVRALCTQQGAGIDVYAFFVPGGDLLRIAEISRVHRTDEGVLHGFQRKEILTHVRSITEFPQPGASPVPQRHHSSAGTLGDPSSRRGAASLPATPARPKQEPSASPCRRRARRRPGSSTGSSAQSRFRTPRTRASPCRSSPSSPRTSRCTASSSSWLTRRAPFPRA